MIFDDRMVSPKRNSGGGCGSFWACKGKLETRRPALTSKIQCARAGRNLGVVGYRSSLWPVRERGNPKNGGFYRGR
jgi:hypothetical protein